MPPGSDPLPVTVGTNPTTDTGAGNAVSLGQNNTVRGLTIGNRSAVGIAIASTSFGTLTVADASFTGTGQALDLTTGTLAVTLAPLSSSSGVSDVELAGVRALTASSRALSAASTRPVDIGGSTATSPWGRPSPTADRVRVADKMAGTVTLSGSSKSSRR